MSSLAMALLFAASSSSQSVAAPHTPPVQVPRILTLEEAIRTARQNQPQLVQARAALEAAGARAGQARAGLLPQIDATASYQRSTSNSVAPPGAEPSNSWKMSNSFGASATLSQLIWDFGQTSGRWRAAQASTDSQRFTERATTLQLLASVRTAFFGARAARDLVKVSRDTLANQDAHLRQVEGFVRAGTRPEIDLAQYRTARANAEVQLITAENGYSTAKARLNQAMGVEGNTDFMVGDDALPAIPGEDLDLDTLVAEAAKNRAELAAQEQQLRALELSLGATKGDYWPTLGASATARSSGPEIDSPALNVSAGLNLTWNLLRGGLTRAQVQEASANLASARAQMATLRQQVRLEVEQARLSVRAAKQTLVAADEALQNASQRLRLAEGRYRAGAGSAIELGDAQLALTSAAAQRVQAEYDLSSSRALLLEALGREGA